MTFLFLKDINIKNIIFSGIVAEIPRALASTFELGRTGALSALMIVGIFILVILIVTLGIPHGAYDYQVAKKIGLVSSNYKVIVFYIVYIGLVFLSLYTWYSFPFFSLLVFLFLSSWHFGSDWAISRNDTLVPILIGICILIFPSMIHQHQITKVFSYLVS